MNHQKPALIRRTEATGDRLPLTGSCCSVECTDAVGSSPGITHLKCLLELQLLPSEDSDINCYYITGCYKGFCRQVSREKESFLNKSAPLFFLHTWDSSWGKCLISKCFYTWTSKYSGETLIIINRLAHWFPTSAQRLQPSTERTLEQLMGLMRTHQ